MGYVSISFYNADSIDESCLVGVQCLWDTIPPRLLQKNIGEIEVPQRLAIKDVKEDVKSSSTTIYLEPQEEGGFVAFSTEYSGAVGQGETREEAIRDLEEAIQLLKEVLEEDKTVE